MTQLQKPSIKDYFNLFALSAIWATAFIGIEIVIEEFHILHVTFGRVLIASLILFPFVVTKKWALPTCRRSTHLDTHAHHTWTVVLM